MHDRMCNFTWHVMCDHWSVLIPAISWGRGKSSLHLEFQIPQIHECFSNASNSPPLPQICDSPRTRSLEFTLSCDDQMKCRTQSSTRDRMQINFFFKSDAFICWNYEFVRQEANMSVEPGRPLFDRERRIVGWPMALPQQSDESRQEASWSQTIQEVRSTQGKSKVQVLFAYSASCQLFCKVESDAASLPSWFNW